MDVLSGVELLHAGHDLSCFDCGAHPALNDWLRKFALQAQSGGSARTYVVQRQMRVVGYYAISAGSVRREQAPVRVAKGQARHPLPVALLGRLAVDKREQGAGLGSALLKDALLRIGAAADVLGIRAVLVHAIDERARAFYQQFDFEDCPEDPLHLMLLLKDLRQRLR